VASADAPPRGKLLFAGHLAPKGALEVGRRLAGAIEKDKKLARANDVSN